MPPFSVQPKAGPSIPFIDKPASTSEAAKSSRERAIQAFLGGQEPQEAQPKAPAPDAFDTALQRTTNAANGIPAPQQTQAPEPTQGREQPNTTEAATSQQDKVVDEAPQQPLSSHYAVLARKEKALRAEVKRLNDERAAFRAEREAARSSASPQAAQPAQTPATESKVFSQERLLNDPIGVYEELGLSTEEIAQRLLNHQPVDKRVNSYIQKLEEKIAKLETSQDETRKTFESAQNASVEQAIENIRFEAQELVNNDPEFATIKATGQAEEVVTLIKGVFDEGLPGKYRKGTLLTVEQAARLVEDELVAQWVEQHEKLSRLEKIQKRLQPKPATPVAQSGTSPQGQAQQQPSQIKTLTNSMAATGKKMSARERAIAVFKGEKVS